MLTAKNSMFIFRPSNASVQVAKTVVQLVNWQLPSDSVGSQQRAVQLYKHLTCIPDSVSMRKKCWTICLLSSYCSLNFFQFTHYTPSQVRVKEALIVIVCLS